MDIREQRLEILKQVENGEMALDEAARWLAALDKVKGNSPPDQPEVVKKPETTRAGSNELSEEGSNFKPAVAVIEPEPVAVIEPQIIHIPDNGHLNFNDPQPPVWAGWWLLIFVPGLLLVVASVNWMNSGLQAAGLSWGFWLSIFPFTLGVILMWLGWEARIARWLHLHIQQKQGSYPREIQLSFPLPMGLLSWGLRRFGHFASPIQGKDIGEFLDEIDRSVVTDGLLHVLVDEPEGSKVEIWIDAPSRR